MNNAYIRAQQCKVKEAKFPFVKIGTQYWTKRNLDLSVTPQGNTIPEVQANGNVEKVVNGGFDTNTGWNITGTWNISGGTANCIDNPVNSVIFQSAALVGRKYKITYTINSISKGSITTTSGGNQGVIRTTTGTFVDYLIANSTNVGFIVQSITTCSIDNVSIQEIGWSGSQELYDGIYAQTAGTVEQKTYAAVKAAAMWSNYNNDAPTGLIYCKLYNWFAVKLFQMDIDYYNAANPTKKWASGFRMPTQTEFQTLSTYLGGDAVSGGHLKEAGLAHWNSPNTGADNSSGFSALGGGARTNDGVSSNMGILTVLWNITEASATYAGRLIVNNTSSTATISSNFKASGYSIRLIKA